MLRFSKALKIFPFALRPFPRLTFNFSGCCFSFSRGRFGMNDLPVNHSHLAVFLKLPDYFSSLGVCFHVCVCESADILCAMY